MSSAESKIHFSLVLACYNEERLLMQSVQDIVSILCAVPYTCELIFVDDFSQDGTRKIINHIVEKFRAQLPIQVLLHDKNMGRGGSVRDGFMAAKGERVGYIDVDLEIAPHYLFPCLLALDRGYDGVVGKRIYKFKWRSLDRYVMSKGYSWLVWRLLQLSGLTDTESGFKLFKRSKILPLISKCQEEGWFWDTEIMALALQDGLKIQEIPCLFIRRFDKVSSVKPFRDVIDYFCKLIKFKRRWKPLQSSESPQPSGRGDSQSQKGVEGEAPAALPLEGALPAPINRAC